jgi:very-short-patch-repair endonuclease
MGAHLTLPNAVISHRTAAELHGFPAAERPAETCEVILSVHRRAGRAIQVHLMHLADADVHVGRAGLRLTSPARTALDCLATMPFGAALDLWAWVSTRGILDRAALASAVLARRNWYGTPQLRRLGDLTASGAISQAEFCFHELLRRAALTGWTANVSIVDGDGLIGLADIAFLTQRVIIEIDGFRSHSSQSAFIADRRRQNRLVMAGYTVLRFTWSDLLNNPDDVITHVRRALAASARRF